MVRSAPAIEHFLHGTTGSNNKKKFCYSQNRIFGKSKHCRIKNGRVKNKLENFVVALNIRKLRLRNGNKRGETKKNSLYKLSFGRGRAAFFELTKAPFMLDFITFQFFLFFFRLLCNISPLELLSIWFSVSMLAQAESCMSGHCLFYCKKKLAEE